MELTISQRKELNDKKKGMRSSHHHLLLVVQYERISKTPFALIMLHNTRYPFMASSYFSSPYHYRHYRKKTSNNRKYLKKYEEKDR